MQPNELRSFQALYHLLLLLPLLHHRITPQVRDCSFGCDDDLTVSDDFHGHDLRELGDVRSEDGDCRDEENEDCDDYSSDDDGVDWRREFHVNLRCLGCFPRDFYQIGEDSDRRESACCDCLHDDARSGGCRGDDGDDDGCRDSSAVDDCRVRDHDDGHGGCGCQTACVSQILRHDYGGLLLRSRLPPKSLFSCLLSSPSASSSRVPLILATPHSSIYAPRCPQH